MESKNNYRRISIQGGTVKEYLQKCKSQGCDNYTPENLCLDCRLEISALQVASGSNYHKEIGAVFIVMLIIILAVLY